MQKEVSLCVEQLWNGFHVTIHMCDKNRQVDLESVDLVCKPVKRLHEIIECYFTNEINQAFIIRYQSHKNDKLNSSSAFVCYYCNAYCILKKFFEKHLQNCARKPEVAGKSAV